MTDCDRNMCFHNIWNDISCEDCPCNDVDYACKRYNELKKKEKKNNGEQQRKEI